MPSLKIRVTNKDNRFGGRNIKISLESKNLTTPNRLATNKDYLATSSLPHKVIIENPISEYISDFNSKVLDAFLQGNGSLQRRTNTINNVSEIMRYTPIISTIQFSKGRFVTQDELMLFSLLQSNPNFDIISIPPFEYKNMRDYKKIITDFTEHALSRNQISMPILPLSTELNSFKREFEALRELHESDICNIIGFKYSKPTSFPQQLLEIYLHREHDIWYHCFGIPRTPPGNKNQDPLAQIHELQNWGLDTFSPMAKQLGKKQIGYFIMKDQSSSPKDLYCQRFDSLTLGILKEDNWKEKYGHDLHCNCHLCHDKDLKSFKQEYSHDLDGTFNPQILRSADKVHELYSGSEEFDDSKSAIKSDDLPSYFDKKDYTKGKIKPPKE